MIEEPVFAELGKKYGKTPAQIILRWHTQMGFVVIPGSKNVDHIKDNLDILDGLAIRGNDSQNKQDSVRSEVSDWLKGLGY